MTGAQEPLGELRRLLEGGYITQDTFEVLAAGLDAKAAASNANANASGAGAVAQGAGATALAQGAAQVQGDVYGTVNLGVLIQQGGQPGASTETLRNAYLARVLRDHNQLPLLAGEQWDEQVQLWQVYTALHALRGGGDSSDAAPTLNQLLEEFRIGPLPVLAVLDAEARLVLMAGPGGGKSTFVNVVAMSLAGEQLGLASPNLATLVAPLSRHDELTLPQDAERAKAQPWRHGPLLPVPVLLRDLASQLPPPGTPVDADTVWAFIEGQLKRKALGDFVPHLHQHLLSQGGLVMFDGLDEVPDAHGRRVQIKQAVQAFAATFSRCRLLVTSRTYAYQRQDWKLDRFAEVQLRPFNDGQSSAFIDAWYGHMATLGRLTLADAMDRAATLKGELKSNPRLRELAGRPLLLTLIAQLQTKGGGALPQRREALYDAAVTMLLDTWEKLKPRMAPDGTPYQEPSLTEFLQVGIDQIRRQLNRLAFEAHRDQPELRGSADIPQAKLIQALLAASPGNPDVKVARLQEYLRDRAGILAEHGVGQVQFPHRSFQEYLAACHLTDDDFPDQLARLTRNDPNRWREVALLAGAKAARGAESAAWALAEALSYETAPLPEGAQPLPAEAVWGALLAGQVLAESARLGEVAPRHAGKRDRIRDWQLALLRRTDLPALERAAAGQNLAALGDPRAEVMTLDGMAFVSVPPGAFWMGVNDAEHNRSSKRVKLDYTFAIARYPVTAAQWREYCVRCGSGVPGRGRDNEPVVAVDWEDVQQFCQWLTGAWSAWLPRGWIVTLPSEVEWEKASRGGEQLHKPRLLALRDLATLTRLMPPDAPVVLNPWPRRVYPWGDKFDAELANAKGTIGGPSAVGAFGDGASVLGVEEMVGNVLEWTRSWRSQEWVKLKFGNLYRVDEWRRYGGQAGDDIRRILRGGCWNLPEDFARCAVRLAAPPGNNGSDAIGFRVILRPPLDV